MDHSVFACVWEDCLSYFYVCQCVYAPMWVWGVESYTILTVFVIFSVIRLPVYGDAINHDKTYSNTSVCLSTRQSCFRPCTFSAVNVTLRLNCFSFRETAVKLRLNMLYGSMLIQCKVFSIWSDYVLGNKIMGLCLSGLILVWKHEWLSLILFYLFIKNKTKHINQ